MIEHTRLVPFAPPSPMTPEISPLMNPSSSSFFPPSAITRAASRRERSLNACQDAPAAAATPAPPTSAPSTMCGCNDKSMIQGLASARVSISATNRASRALVFRVANTAMVGFDLRKKNSRNADIDLSHPDEWAARSYALKEWRNYRRVKTIGRAELEP